MTIYYRHYLPRRQNIVSGSLAASLQRGFNFQAAQKNTLACTATSNSVEFTGNGTDFEVKNIGTTEAFIAWGGPAVTVAAGGSSTAQNDGGLSIPGGAILIYNATDLMVAQQGGPIYVAGICASGGSTTLRIAQGTGS